jgi:predicted GNAT family acetyltransferase
MRSAGHVARMGDIANGNKISVEETEAKRQLRDRGVDGRTILKWLLDFLCNVFEVFSNYKYQ